MSNMGRNAPSSVKAFCEFFLSGPDPDEGLVAEVSRVLSLVLVAEAALAEASPPMSLMRWMLTEGRWRYRRLRELFSAEACARMAQRLPLGPERRGVMTPLMNLVWHLERDIQESFPIATRSQAEAFAAWYTVHGIRNLGLFDVVSPSQRRFLMQLDPEFGMRAGIPITRFQADIWRQRRDVAAQIDLYRADGPLAFLRWYVVYGMSEYRCYRALTAEQIALLAGPSSAVAADGFDDLPLMPFLVWQERADVQQSFDLQTAESRAALRHWFIDYGAAEYGVNHWQEALRASLGLGEEAGHCSQPEVACFHFRGDVPMVEFPDGIARTAIDSAASVTGASVDIPSKIAIWAMPAEQAAALLLNQARPAAINILLDAAAGSGSSAFDGAWTFGLPAGDGSRSQNARLYAAIEPYFVEPPPVEPQAVLDGPYFCVVLSGRDADARALAGKVVQAALDVAEKAPEAERLAPVIVWMGGDEPEEMKRNGVVCVNGTDHAIRNSIISGAVASVLLDPAPVLDTEYGRLLGSGWPVVGFDDPGRARLVGGNADILIRRDLKKPHGEEQSALDLLNFVNDIHQGRMRTRFAVASAALRDRFSADRSRRSIRTALEAASRLLSAS